MSLCSVEASASDVWMFLWLMCYYVPNLHCHTLRTSTSRSSLACSLSLRDGGHVDTNLGRAQFIALFSYELSLPICVRVSLLNAILNPTPKKNSRDIYASEATRYSRSRHSVPMHPPCVNIRTSQVPWLLLLFRSAVRMPTFTRLYRYKLRIGA